MLTYTWRVRDIVHGTILFTEEERSIIESPLFVRLRQVRQNDLTSTIFPSLNTTRFEHVLGACHIAGKIAEQLTRSPDWGHVYVSRLRADYPEFNYDPEKQFVRVARLYALLHDIGHFPLSHLFEDAFARHAQRRGKQTKELVSEWFASSDFEKPHEAFGAYLAERFTRHGSVVAIQRPLEKLLTEKTFYERDPLILIKKVVDAEVDADRIDFVRRDGLMAGGEYGNYDINRLTSSALIVVLPDGKWDVAFEDRAATSLESLFLDRYRTYLWLHFHHRAVAVKACAIRLIEIALAEGKIKSAHFTAGDDKLALRDDVWMMNIFRSIKPKDETVKLMQEAVLYHARQHVFPVWKRRARYSRLHKELAERLELLGKSPQKLLKARRKHSLQYKKFLSERMGAAVMHYPISFMPVKLDAPVRLFSSAERNFRGEILSNISPMVQNLNTIWESGDPQEFVFLVGRDLVTELEGRTARDEIGRKWVEATTAFHMERGSDS